MGFRRDFEEDVLQSVFGVVELVERWDEKRGLIEVLSDA